MIQELCNSGHENFIDTPFKIAVFEISAFPFFNQLTSDATIESIITNLPNTAQVFYTELLPKNIQVSNPTKINTSGKTYTPHISFTLTPQDKNLQALLETFNNKEVIVLVSKRTTDHLYGTTAQPLLFVYHPLNANDPQSVKGYTVNIDGETFGPEAIFENVVFNIYSRGLAFQLAGDL